MPWLLGAVLPPVIFHNSRGVAQQQQPCPVLHSSAHSPGSSAGWLCRGDGSAVGTALLGSCTQNPGHNSGKETLLREGDAPRSNFLCEAKLIKCTQWKSSPGEVEARSSSSLIFKPCLKPPLGSLSLPEVPLQLLPPSPLLHLPTQLQLYSPQSSVSDKPCDDAQPASGPAFYLLRCYTVYHDKWRHFRTPSNEGIPQ